VALPRPFSTRPPFRENGRKNPKPYKRGATLEDGTWVRSSRELQLLEPVKSMVPPPSSGRGRPTAYTEEVANWICSELAQGKTLLEICAEDSSLPDHSTIRAWAASNYQGFYGKYARARDIGLDAMAEQLFAIADDRSNDYIERVSENGKIVRVPDHERIARSRIRIDARKWYLSKLAPKRYGDRISTDAMNAPNDELAVTLAEALTPEELESLKQKLIAVKEAKMLAQTQRAASTAATNVEPTGTDNSN
jgi:hypothetical protein